MASNVCAFFLIVSVCLVFTNRCLEIGIVKKKILAVVNYSFAGNLRTLAGIFGRSGTICNGDYIPVGFITMEKTEVVIAGLPLLSVASASLTCSYNIFLG